MENWLGSSLIQIQGWMNDLNMLLLCFGEKMPGTQHAENASLFVRSSPPSLLCEATENEDLYGGQFLSGLE